MAMSLKHGRRMYGLTISSKAMAARELTPEETVLKEDPSVTRGRGIPEKEEATYLMAPLKTAEMKSPAKPGILLQISITNNGKIWKGQKIFEGAKKRVEKEHLLGHFS